MEDKSVKRPITGEEIHKFLEESMSQRGSLTKEETTLDMEMAVGFSSVGPARAIIRQCLKSALEDPLCSLTAIISVALSLGFHLGLVFAGMLPSIAGKPDEPPAPPNYDISKVN